MNSQPLIIIFYTNLLIKGCECIKQSLNEILEALEFAQKIHLIYMRMYNSLYNTIYVPSSYKQFHIFKYVHTKVLFCLAPMCPERHLDGAAMLGHDVQNSKKSDAGAILGDMMRKFMDEMKIPDGLTALNYTKADVPALVAGAIPQVSNYNSYNS